MSLNSEAATGERKEHESITGGCLCKAVRYTIKFPEGSWPPLNNTCQCTQCRKATGAVVAHIVSVNPSTIQWVCEDRSFREYSSSPGVFRGFCQNCGSTLTWRNEMKPTEIDVFPGTFDEEVLIGGDGSTGKALLTVDTQWFCENAVKGISDGLRTKTMYKTDKNGGQWTPGEYKYLGSA